MPRFLIERHIPDAGRLDATALAAVAQRSCAVLRELGPDVQWVQSYVTGDRITCVYVARDAELLREHARRGGFPADRIDEVVAIVDPTTAEADVPAGAAAG